MTLKNKYFKNEVFKKTYFTYLLLILAMAIAVISIYSIITFKDIKRENVAISNEIATNISNEIDSKIQSINTLSTELYKSPWITKFNSGFFEDEFTTFSRMEYVNEINLLSRNSDIIETVALIFPELDTAINRQAWTDIQDGNSFLNINFGIDLSSAFADEEFTIKPYYDSQDYLLISHNLIISTTPECVALIVISKDALKAVTNAYMGISSDQRLQEFKIDINYAEQPKTEILMVSAQNTNRKPAKEISHKSRYSNLEYSYSFTDIIPLENSKGILLILLLSPSLLVIASFISYYLSILTVKPINNIFKKILDSNHETSTSLSVIDKACDKIINENNSLKETAEEYHFGLRNNFISRLLRGYFTTEVEQDSLENTLSFYSIPFSSNAKFMVCLITFPYEIIKDSVVEQLTDFSDKIGKIPNIMQSNGVLSELSICEIAIILTNNNQGDFFDSASFEDAILKTADKILGVCPEVSVGPICDGIIGISKSYHWAISQRDKSVVQISETQNQQSNIYYPHDWELQLVSGINSGNIELENSILKEIIIENSKMDTKSPNEKELVCVIRNTIIKVINENSLDIRLFQDRLDSISSSHAIKSTWDTIHLLVCEIASVISNTNPKKENLDSDTLLINYVDLHYTDSSLSLKELAQQFNTSISAVSRSFKKVTGVNFLEYITKLRMEKAKKLLVKEKHSMHDICLAVGYEHDYSFRRAFERYQGVCLQDYRKQLNNH